jgi:hypothetical protein
MISPCVLIFLHFGEDRKDVGKRRRTSSPIREWDLSCTDLFKPTLYPRLTFRSLANPSLLCFIAGGSATSLSLKTLLLPAGASHQVTSANNGAGRPQHCWARPEVLMATTATNLNASFVRLSNETAAITPMSAFWKIGRRLRVVLRNSLTGQVRTSDRHAIESPRPRAAAVPWES